QLEGMDFGLIRKGLLMLFRTEGGQASCVEEAELAQGIGVEAEVLKPGELQKLEPNISFSATGGVYFPGDAHLSPSLFFEQMNRLVQREGALIDHSTEVLGFEQSDGHITGVRTSSGLHEGDSFVVAGGAWSSTLLRGLDLTLPLQAGKGYSVTLDHPSRKPAIPLILTESRVAVTPFPESIRLAGTMELAGNDLSINRRRVSAILMAASRYITDIELPPLEETRPWAGLRPCSPDGLPYIGRFDAFQNLIAATGHAMLGITMAPITGKLVADLVTGRSITLNIQLLAPDRFNRG
ncbi:MAG: FAD-dependent oxidoreductase, partial [Bacteroidetes bacterium]|nr:FAD-dependent oxidoreductase [Bacteroidota bacterium]